MVAPQETSKGSLKSLEFILWGLRISAVHPVVVKDFSVYTKDMSIPKVILLA